MKDEKPPVGIMPRSIHNRYRASDLIDAMQRYTKEGRNIPLEWINELDDINSYNKRHGEQHA
jgi:hypothetical protein